MITSENIVTSNNEKRELFLHGFCRVVLQNNGAFGQCRISPSVKEGESFRNEFYNNRASKDIATCRKAITDIYTQIFGTSDFEFAQEGVNVDKKCQNGCYYIIPKNVTMNQNMSQDTIKEQFQKLFVEKNLGNFNTDGKLVLKA